MDWASWSHYMPCLSVGLEGKGEKTQSPSADANGGSIAQSAKYLVPVSEQQNPRFSADVTSESPFDRGCHVITQFFRSTQGSLDPYNLHLAGRDLSGRFAVTSCSHQAALVAG